MATVIKHARGHYEVHELPYAKDFDWCPECVVLECDCKRRLTLTTSETTCECGADHTSLVREELESRAVGDDPQPIEDECEKWRKKQGQYLRSEDNDWQEWKTLD